MKSSENTPIQSSELQNLQPQEESQESQKKKEIDDFFMNLFEVERIFS